MIWAAICIDYPGHSFSELGIFYGACHGSCIHTYLFTLSDSEGANGRLPNQDLINSLSVISKYTGNVQIVLYDQSADELRARISEKLPNSLKQPVVINYAMRAYHILRHMGFQASGRPSGVHGLFHK